MRESAPRAPGDVKRPRLAGDRGCARRRALIIQPGVRCTFRARWSASSHRAGSTTMSPGVRAERKPALAAAEEALLRQSRRVIVGTAVSALYGLEHQPAEGWRGHSSRRGVISLALTSGPWLSARRPVSATAPRGCAASISIVLPVPTSPSSAMAVYGLGSPDDGVAQLGLAAHDQPHHRPRKQAGRLKSFDFWREAENSRTTRWKTPLRHRRPCKDRAKMFRCCAKRG